MLVFVFVLVGFALGVFVTVWFFLNNRLRWGIPRPVAVDEDFSNQSPYWTNLCIGDAAIELIQDRRVEGGVFARLMVRRAMNGQLALAQIDDYLYRPFADYCWHPPLIAEFRVRLSDNVGPGTMGFWFWNNAMGLGAELTDLRPPKWIGFVRISSEAEIAYTDVDARFRATVVNSSWLSMASLGGLPLLPDLEAAETSLDGVADWTAWHTFCIEWFTTRIRLSVDGKAVLSTETRIRGPLSMALWYDNNRPQIDKSQLVMTNDEIKVPAWLDVDYVRINALDARKARVRVHAEAGAGAGA